MNRRPPPPLLSAVEEAADIALGSAQIAQKAAKKVVDALLIPDPRDDLNWQRLTAQPEQAWLARINPRRNRWPELRQLDERVDELDRRQDELRVRLIELRGRRERADAEHADALAQWMAAARPQEPKPISEAKALDEAIVESDAEHAAIDSLRAGVLEERIAFVQKHRKRLVRDAERATEQAKQRYLEAVDELERAREELVGLNETRIWAQLFPSETLRTFPPSHALAGGRLRATERHLPGVKSELPAHAVIALLRADAEHFASVSTVDQAAEAKGVSRGELKGDEAMWAGSDADKAWREREKQRRVEEYASVFGQPPPEFG